MSAKYNLTLISVIFLCWSMLAGEQSTKPATAEEIAANLTAVQVLHECKSLIPVERLLLKGSMTVRKLRGIVLHRQLFTLLLDWGATPPNAEILLLNKEGDALVERAILNRPQGLPATIQLFKGSEQQPGDTPSYASRIQDTDMTWLDLTLDFLWWENAVYDTPSTGQSRNGRDCVVIIAKPPAALPGCDAVRVWVDAQILCVMQAEQLNPAGKDIRRMWVQRAKKMEGRWMIKDMEIETIGSGHRTRLSIDDVSEP